MAEKHGSIIVNCVSLKWVAKPCKARMTPHARDPMLPIKVYAPPRGDGEEHLGSANILAFGRSLLIKLFVHIPGITGRYPTPELSGVAA